MKALFVGQLVKIVRHIDGPEPIGYYVGMERRIEAITDKDHGFNYDLGLAFPCTFCAEELEPILPSGQVAVTLEQLLSVPGLESLDKILGVKV